MTGETLSIDQKFLRKLADTLETHLESESFGVNELANEIGLSRSQLHRKLHRLNGKSASQFIREYRLKKALTMLQNDEATVSEISYSVGFGSPTYFNTCFHEFYGFTPGEAKFKTQTLSENIEEKESSVIQTPLLHKISKKKFERSVLLILIPVILFLASLLYYFSNNSGKTFKKGSAKIIVNDKSIGILPFKNLSDDSENQYFADGVMNDILTHLSSIKDLKVISAVTMEHFRETPKTAPQITKELSISYLLIGSIQKYDNKVRFIVQLIDAKRDQQLWSNDFQREYKDIFNLESEISKQVAAQLKMVLSPLEIKHIEKTPTENLEAYNFYLKGRYFNDKYGEEDLNYSVNYLEKAIELDSGFALAYAVLADTKLRLDIYGFSDRNNIYQVKKTILKTIALDPSIAEVHAAYGYLLCWYERNWKEAEKEFEISIKLNPNYDRAYFYYSRYLHFVKGDFTKAREYIDKALIYNPFSYEAIMYSATYYMQAGDLQKALAETRKGKEIDNRELWAYWLDFENYALQGKSEKAIEELERGYSFHPELSEIIKSVRIAFNTSGTNGIYKWFNDYDISNEFLRSSVWIAEKFAVLGENDKALDWLETTFEIDPVELIQIKFDRHFINLHNEPRFLALLNKMGLGDYD